MFAYRVSLHRRVDAIVSLVSSIASSIVTYVYAHAKGNTVATQPVFLCSDELSLQHCGLEGAIGERFESHFLCFVLTVSLITVNAVFIHVHPQLLLLHVYRSIVWLTFTKPFVC